ncbi:MAG: J domain-containing protein [Pseudomonadota bacterium]|nr:J domain-containing protein [Pseudomonadota bacterium]
MNNKSPLNFDISVSADKKRRARNRGKSGGFAPSGKKCHHKGCELEGSYRAPKSPDLIDEFHWFCVKHVREYNSKWNFFENHSSEELEEHLKDDAVWSRKTAPLGAKKDKVHSEGKSWARMGFDDPYDFLDSPSAKEPVTSKKHGTQKRLSLSERKALEILDARDSMTKSEIRVIYKTLVKDLHPDMNGGRRDDEERLTEVVWAWDQIKVSRSFKE